MGRPYFIGPATLAMIGSLTVSAMGGPPDAKDTYVKPLPDEYAGAMAAIGAYSSPMACYGNDEAHLQEAITKARQLAYTCLIGDERVKGGLNPELGRRLVDSDGAHGVSFHCNYLLKNAQASTNSRGSPNIGVKIDEGLRPDQDQSVQEIRSIDITVFHELIHAVDPDDKRLFSLWAHNRVSPFPDGVYGCEFACGGSMDAYTYVRSKVLVFEALVRPLPELSGYSCPPEASGSDCSTLKKFAWLCSRNSMPELSGDEEEGFRMFEDAACIKTNGQELIDAKADHPLGEATYKAALGALKWGEANQLNRGDAAFEAKQMAAFSDVVVQAMHANMLEKLWFVAFLKKHGCPELPE
jgi:hypothetical protein